MALSPRGVIRNENRRETKPHGTARFPCAGYGYALTDRPGDVVPWHWHDEFEAVYIKEGTMDLGVISRHVILHQGELAVLNSNTLHAAKAVGYCELQSFVFSPRLITGDDNSVFAVRYVKPLCDCNSFVCMKFPKDYLNDRGFLEAFRELKDDVPGYEFTVRDQLSRIILDVYRHYEEAIRNSDSQQDLDAVRISQMLGFIREHFSEHLVLSDISKAANIGEREALRCFKRTIGESPMQYLLKYRLMQSADQLKEMPGKSVAAVAGDCGFDSPSYYTKKFHEMYQCTPREYAKAETYTASGNGDH